MLYWNMWIYKIGLIESKSKVMERLIRAIKNNRFRWEHYLSGGTWYGIKVQTQPLFCSYGQIGYNVFVDYGKIILEWDWEKQELTREK